MIFIGRYLIKVVYGNEYLLGASSLYFLSILILITPLIGLYSIIFQSKEKPEIVSNAILISLIANILLNFAAIFLFKGNFLYTIAGVGFATAFARVILLGILIFQARKQFNFKIRGVGLKVPLFATISMSVFLFAFNQFFDVNLWRGILEIIIGIGIYFSILILLKGINKEDWVLIKSLFKK